ncbi:MAG: DNA polymerase III subunit beta, partial [Verrucomicrobiota bacterium]|nr:DNA polymerase III subunit beta [Verrucomicrobiota bacterium]
EGTITLPVKKLNSIAKEADGNQILMQLNGEVCAIESGAYSTKMNGLPAEEFPPKVDFSEDGTIRNKQKKLRSMIKRTVYAVSNDENRYVLNGLYVSFKGEKLTIVATDGRRLAMAEQEVEQKKEELPDIIVPTKAIQELNRLLGEEGQIELKINENQASFETIDKEGNTDVQIVTKLVEGAYPNYKQVIPSESKHRVSIDKEELLSAVKRASIMTSEKANSIKLTFSENNLLITSNTPEIGESRETMAIKYSGEETSIAFNPQFLIDPLTAMEEKEIDFEFTDQLSPGVIRTKQPFLYVIMPMRTS